jgi:acetylornithine/N-succinyldiaminopimelate aminotransferase
MLGLRGAVPNGDIVAAARDRHVLVIAAGDNVVRLLPPLVISDDEIAEAVRRLDAACADIVARRAAPAAPEGEADPHRTSAVLKGAA